MHRFLALPALKDMGRRYDDTSAPNGRLVSCLHVAAANGNTELVDLLVKRGADPDQTYGEDFTRASPMAFAVENDRLETFRKLLELGKIFGPHGTLKVDYLAEFLKVNRGFTDTRLQFFLQSSIPSLRREFSLSNC